MGTSEPDYSVDKLEILSRVHQEWEALSAVVTVLDEPQLIRRDPGEWSVMDILAHLAAWEKFLIVNQFLGMSAAEGLCVDQDVIDRADENEVNAILFERNRDRPLSEVLTNWYETHLWLMSELAKIGEDELTKTTLCFGPEPKPLALWVFYNTYDHYIGHRKTIQMKQGK